MPEPQAVSSGMARLVTTAELGRFETCRLAWWYDRTHPLAHATPADIARRLELFEAVYGPGVRDLPEYHLLTHLRDQEQPASPTTQPPPSAPALPTDKPHRLIGCVLVAMLAILMLLLLSILLPLARL